MLFAWLSCRRDDARLTAGAGAIGLAAAEVIATGAPLRPDLGGDASTREMPAAIAERAERFAAEGRAR